MENNRHTKRAGRFISWLHSNRLIRAVRTNLQWCRMRVSGTFYALLKGCQISAEIDSQVLVCWSCKASTWAHYESMGMVAVTTLGSNNATLSLHGLVGLKGAKG